MDPLLLQQSKGTVTPPVRQKISHGLIDAAYSIIESIWPSHSICKTIALTPLKPFLVQTLRESKVSIITLQIALMYLLRIKIAGNYANSCPGGPPNFAKCGRRMFIAALIVAGKFIQDKHVKNCVWAKFTRTPLLEINMVELAFLRLIDYNLFVPAAAFVRWSTLLSNYICTKESCPPLTASCEELFGHLSKPNRKYNRFSPYVSHRRKGIHPKSISVDSDSMPVESVRFDYVPQLPLAQPLGEAFRWNSIPIKTVETLHKRSSSQFQSSPPGLQPRSPISNTSSPEESMVP
ncbi:PHO85 cyclin-5 [Basidiobolus ranarum]|uniref:PHO85 cyclin-5 n=1 Tax=Basidiobolus ranarum TaxID=34480 RepID=A0ABR2WYK3_9FUNG